MNPELKDLLQRNMAALEDARWALESVRVKYVIGEDVSKLEALEAALSALIVEDVRAINGGRA